MEFSKEMNRSIEEAGKDTAWVKKLRAAATWEEYERLLAEKGIEAPAELKEIYAAAHSSTVGKLADDELESVSGGWDFGFLPCNKEYSDVLCRWTSCPHMKLKDEQTGGASLRYYCDLYHWETDIAVVGGY